MSNLLTTKAKIQRIVRTKEGLEAFRADVMKAHALGKSLYTRDYIATYKLSSMFLTFLIKLGAVEDLQPDAPRTEGKHLKWIYTKTGENGPVDSPLAEALINEQTKYDQAYRRERNEQKGISNEITPTIVEKKPMTSAICTWLEKELKKDELLDGEYLKVDARTMYNRIIGTFNGLKELQEAMSKIKL